MPNRNRGGGNHLGSAWAAMPQPALQYPIQNRDAAGINIHWPIPLRPQIRFLPANPRLGQWPSRPEPAKSREERRPDR